MTTLQYCFGNENTRKVGKKCQNYWHVGHVEHGKILGKQGTGYILWRCGVVVITTAQLHSTKTKLWFCAGSNPARGVQEIRDGEDL